MNTVPLLVRISEDIKSKFKAAAAVRQMKLPEAAEEALSLFIEKIGKETKQKEEMISDVSPSSSKEVDSMPIFNRQHFYPDFLQKTSR